MRAPAPERVFVFAGPTLATSERARRALKGLKLRRPVRRRDVARLVEAERRPGVIALVDGVFHDAMAVGHAEIRDALERGWRVWGLASMGAIRAREMAHLGMRGWGRVFDRFVAEDDFQDDEVALLHEPTAPYAPVSEPLVHWRAAIDHLVARGLLDADAAREVIADLKGRWYGERTRSRVMHLLRPRARDVAAVAREMSDFDRFRWKTLDLESFLRDRPFSSDHVVRSSAFARSP